MATGKLLPEQSRDHVDANEAEARSGTRKHRWYQYRLRTLLLLLLVAAIASSWLAARIQRARRYATRDELFQSLQSNTLQIKPIDQDIDKLFWGRFSSGSGLSGEDLYLFPDETYYYTEWADIWPRTIHEKGNWQYKDGLLVLSPDGSLPKDSGARNHTYLPFYVKHRGTEQVAIIGVEWNLKELLESGGFLGAGTYLIYSYSKVESIASDKATEYKQQLFSNCWRPEAFKK